MHISQINFSRIYLHRAFPRDKDSIVHILGNDTLKGRSHYKNKRKKERFPRLLTFQGSDTRNAN
jgi:hypothetical protein